SFESYPKFPTILPLVLYISEPRIHLFFPSSTRLRFQCSFAPSSANPAPSQLLNPLAASTPPSSFSAHQIPLWSSLPLAPTKNNTTPALRPIHPMYTSSLLARKAPTTTSLLGHTPIRLHSLARRRAGLKGRIGTLESRWESPHADLVL
ncbi:hypothetical protein WG66_013574, partial [Moniliophthora roreri]